MNDLDFERAPTLYAIDFGTTSSLLAAANPHRTWAPIPLDPGAHDPSLLRSLLFFGEKGHFACGVQAIADFVEGSLSGRLIRSIKKFLPDRSFTGTRIGSRLLTIEELIARFLRVMRERADSHFGRPVDRVLFGRPARYSADDAADALAVDRMKEAAKLAGFREISFCPEPVAAAHDFHLDTTRPTNVLVADFGGGTSDYTVVRMKGGTFSPGDVLALGGVSIAGDALDGCIMRRRVAKHFGAEVTYKVPFGKNVLTMPVSIVEKLSTPADMTALNHRDILSFLADVRAWSLGPGDRKVMDQLFCLVEDSLAYQIFDAIERTKCALSAQDRAEVVFEYPSISIREPLDRQDFERAAESKMQAILGSLDRTVASAKLTFDDIDVVCSTGGTAKVPWIAAGLAQRFGAGKVRKLSSFHSVVQGLSERARQIAAEA